MNMQNEHRLTLEVVMRYPNPTVFYKNLCGERKRKRKRNLRRGRERKKEKNYSDCRFLDFIYDNLFKLATDSLEI